MFTVKMFWPGFSGLNLNVSVSYRTTYGTGKTTWTSSNQYPNAEGTQSFSISSYNSNIATFNYWDVEYTSNSNFNRKEYSSTLVVNLTSGNNNYEGDILITPVFTAVSYYDLNITKDFNSISSYYFNGTKKTGNYSTRLQEGTSYTIDRITVANGYQNPKITMSGLNMGTEVSAQLIGDADFEISASPIPKKYYDVSINWYNCTGIHSFLINGTQYQKPFAPKIQQIGTFVEDTIIRASISSIISGYENPVLYKNGSSFYSTSFYLTEDVEISGQASKIPTFQISIDWNKCIGVDSFTINGFNYSRSSGNPTFQRGTKVSISANFDTNFGESQALFVDGTQWSGTTATITDIRYNYSIYATAKRTKIVIHLECPSNIRSFKYSYGTLGDLTIHNGDNIVNFDVECGRSITFKEAVVNNENYVFDYWYPFNNTNSTYSHTIIPLNDGKTVYPMVKLKPWTTSDLDWGVGSDFPDKTLSVGFREIKRIRFQLTKKTEVMLAISSGVSDSPKPPYYIYLSDTPTPKGLDNELYGPEPEVPLFTKKIDTRDTPGIVLDNEELTKYIKSTRKDYYLWIKTYSSQPLNKKPKYSISLSSKDWHILDSSIPTLPVTNQAISIGEKGGIYVYQFNCTEKGTISVKTSRGNKGEDTVVRLASSKNFNPLTGIPENTISPQEPGYSGYMNNSYKIQKRGTYYFFISFYDFKSTGNFTLSISGLVTPDFKKIDYPNPATEATEKLPDWQISYPEEYTLYYYQFSFGFLGTVTFKTTGNNYTEGFLTTNENFKKKEGTPNDWLYDQKGMILGGVPTNYTFTYKIEPHKTYYLCTKIIGEIKGPLNICISKPIAPKIDEGVSFAVCTGIDPIKWTSGKIFYCYSSYNEENTSKVQRESKWKKVGFQSYIEDSKGDKKWK